MEATKFKSVIKALVLSSWDHVLGPTTNYLWRSQYSGEFWTAKPPSGRNSCDFSSTDGYTCSCQKNAGDDKKSVSISDSYLVGNNSCSSKEDSEPVTNCMDINCSNTIKNEDLFETVSYLVGQMLHGHLIAPYPARTICTKEVFVCDKDLFLYAIVFQQKYTGRFKTAENECVPHCLALILSYSDWNFYHNVRQFVEQYMKQMVAVLADAGGSENSASAIGSAVVLVKDLDEKLWTLKCCASERQQKIPYHLTYFGAHRKFSKRFLERAIASHLHTCCYSVVTGESLEEINLMVQTLSVFLEPSERICIRFASSKEMWPYLPGLFIQGLLKDSHGKSNISVDAVLQNLHPTTLIDLSHEKVRQSPFPVPHDHLFSQLRLTANKQAERSWTTDSAFKTVNESGKLVPNFIQELSQILSEESRGQYAEYFYTFLKAKARVLLSLIEKSIDAKKPVLNSFMIGVGVSELADLHVILGIAEKLKPGTRNKVLPIIS